MIEIRQTSTGREHWDTPEVKIGTGRKERIRKDRYSSLLMANMAARQTRARRIQDDYNIVGGFAEMSNKKKISGLDFIAPAWAADLNNIY